MRMILLIAVLLGVGLLVRLVDQAGIDLVPDLHGLAYWLIPVIAAIELRRVVRTLSLVTRRRQLRTIYRMPLDVPVAVAGSTPDETSLLGRTRDISPFGLGLELPAPVEERSVLRASLKLPGLSSAAARSVDIRVEVQSCRPRGDRWIVGAYAIGADDETRRRIVEYCYLVSQRDRLRGPHAIPLPAPGEIEPPSQLSVAA